MRWQFLLKDVSTEGDLREKVLRKVEPMGKYLVRVRKDLRQGVVRIAKGERWGYRVKMEVKLPGKELVAEARGKELLSAVDASYQKLARKVRKHYERLREKRGVR